MQCDRLTGIRAFIDQLRDMNVTRHMIIGPGCSGGATIIAETAPFYQLTQVNSLAIYTRNTYIRSCNKMG